MKKNLDLSKMASKLATSKWMLPPTNHAALVRLVDAYMTGKLTYSPLEPDMPVSIENHEEHPAEMDDTEMVDSTCVIKISGVLSKGISELEEVLLGLADVDEIMYALDKAAADTNVKNIVLAFSSPGGETLGIEELGRRIKAIDENVKPVFGWTESQATSAAYWLLSQTRTVGMIPSSQVGGVGVYSLVLNATGQMKADGIEVEVFSAGEYKMMGHEFRTLSDAERAIIQADVDKQFQAFKEVVQAKRTRVNSDDLNGLSFEGRDALSKGFCDVLHDDFIEFLTETVQ
jgi:signal peptide peptidase SppA